MKQSRHFNFASAVVLGMHDALVSLTGLIAGLTFADMERGTIVMTAIIASVTAGLSMSASNYLAEKSNQNKYALRAGAITGTAYIATSIILVSPYLVGYRPYLALIFTLILVVVIIFGCNLVICRQQNKKFWRHAIEMLVICGVVSIISFCIGEIAKHTLGIDV